MGEILLILRYIYHRKGKWRPGPYTDTELKGGSHPPPKSPLPKSSIAVPVDGVCVLGYGKLFTAARKRQLGTLYVEGFNKKLQTLPIISYTNLYLLNLQNFDGV